MKKKLLVFSGIIALAIAGFIADAAVKPNPECPNGCLKDGPGCYCNGWYECLKEAGSSTTLQQIY